MKKRNFFLYIFFLIVIIICIFLLSKSSFFKIKQITCFVEKEACPEQLRSQVGILLNKSIFFNNLDFELSNSQLEKSSYLLESISKEIPNKIIVNFKKQEQSYLTEIDGQIFLINQDGSLTQVEESDKQKLEFNSSLKEQILQTQKVPINRHTDILILLAEIEKNKAEVSKIKISEKMILLELKNNRQVLIGENPAQAIQNLSLILDKFDFTKHESEIAEIDLRFKLPVLRANKSRFQILD